MDVLFVNSTVELTLKKEINGTMLLATKLLQDGFDVDVLRFGQIKSYDGEYTQFIRDTVDEILRRSGLLSRSGA